MELLPKFQSEFSSVKYWENFFSKRTRHFEWYGNYMELCGILHRYIKEKDDLLVVGCGNSQLSEQLYDAGYQKILNIDKSKTVIKQMHGKNADRKGMMWMEMDVTDLNLQDNSYSVVLDKGTLDAMMSDSTENANKTIDKMFNEISRVLRVGGRYILISLAQDHILNKILDYFPSNSWLLRIHKVWKDTSDEGSYLPVFLFVFTKFINLPRKILEVCLEDAMKATKLNSEEEVKEFIKTQQYYAMLRSELSREGSTDNLPPVTLFSAENISVPRYTIHLVDLKSHKTNQIYGIFIVPSGREVEWLFNSHPGRLKVAESAQFKRLALVSLSRDHSYSGGMAQIQSELSSKVMELAPTKLPANYKVPFLSIGGDDIGERIVRFRGESSYTGPFVVEDYIGDDGHWYRQLLFQSSLVQTVVKLKQSPKGGKSRNRKKLVKTDSSNLVVDPSYFASQYIQIMVSGIPGVVKSMDDKLRVLIIGLGGGSLVISLLNLFKNCHVTALEIDPSVVQVAKSWFGLEENKYAERAKLFSEDGLKWVSSLATTNRSLKDEDETRELYDVVVIDADSKDDSKCIRAPPSGFIEHDYLLDIREILKEGGALMMNVVSREQSAKESLIEKIRPVFPNIYLGSCSTDVNDVLFCYHDLPCNLTSSHESEKSDVMKLWKSRAKSWDSEAKNKGLDLCSFLNDVVKIS